MLSSFDTLERTFEFNLTLLLKWNDRESSKIQQQISNEVLARYRRNMWGRGGGGGGEGAGGGKRTSGEKKRDWGDGVSSRNSF